MRVDSEVFPQTVSSITGIKASSELPITAVAVDRSLLRFAAVPMRRH